MPLNEHGVQVQELFIGVFLDSKHQLFMLALKLVLNQLERQLGTESDQVLEGSNQLPPKRDVMASRLSMIEGLLRGEDRQDGINPSEHL